MVGEHLGDDLYGRPLATMREYLEVLVPLVDHGQRRPRGRPLHVHARPWPWPATDAADRAGRGAGRADAASSPAASPTARSRRGRVRTRCATTSCPTITRAAADAGNPPPRIASIFQVCVTDDVDRAREQVHQWFEFHGKAPSYEAMLEREGVASASDVAIVGTEDEVRRRILELADIGVTDLVVGEVLAPGETDTLRTRRLLAELAAPPRLRGERRDVSGDRSPAGRPRRRSTAWRTSSVPPRVGSR